MNNKNALAELAMKLIDAMTAIAETGLIEDRHVDTINRAQRIVAELAKVSNISQIPMSYWNCKELEALRNCRVIAEEWMMLSKNETVADIKSEMYGIVADEFGYVRLAQSDFIGFADRSEAAHKREVDSLNFKLMTAKSEQKTAANVIIEQTDKVERLEREIAELRECLRGALAGVCAFCENRKVDSCKDGHICESITRWRKVLEGDAK